MKKITKFFTFSFFALFVQIGMAQDSWNNLEYNPDQKNIEYNPLKGLMPSFDEVNNDFPSSTEKFYIPLNKVFKNWNTYDWSALENLMNKAAAKGHHCIPRFYLDYPDRDFAMPEFLRSSVSSYSYSDHGNNKSRSPDYKSETLMKALEEFIAAFGQRYNNDPRMGFIDIGLYGFWGEWHVYPRNDFEMPQANKDRLLRAYLKAFPNKKLIIRDPEATPNSNFKNAIGYYDDSFGLSTMKINWGFWEKMKRSGLTNSWKTHPMAGEVHPSIDEKDLFAKWSYVNGEHDNNFEDCIRTTHASVMVKHGLFSSSNLNSTVYKNALRATKLMGYQFFVKSVKLNPKSNNSINVELKIQNRGIAPFYYDWKVELGAISTANGSFKSISTSSFNLPEMQPSTQDYSRSVVTNTLPKGDYKIVMRVQNPLKSKTSAAKPLRFANTTQDADRNEWVTLGTVKVGAGVTEEDTTAPTISLKGESNINLTVGDTYTEQGATATDNEDGNLTSDIVITGNTDTDTAGTYTVNYNVSDAAGNAADEVSRTIIVSEIVSEEEDTIAPIITLKGNSTINLNIGDTYVEQGTTVWDNVDSYFDVVITGNTDTDTAGTYTVNYNVSDAAGNAADEVSRTVIVSASSGNQLPIASFLGISEGENLPVGSSILPIVNASDADGSIANVSLFINNRFVRRENVVPYEWGHKLNGDTRLKNLKQGVYTLKAEVRDNDRGLTVITLDFTVGGNANSNENVNLLPIHDAYLENNRKRFNTDIVRVENNRRVTYLMFDVSQFNGNLSNAVLQFKVASDAGHGNVNVYLGSSNDWTEDDLSRFNKPGKGKLVGSIDSRYKIGSLIEIPLTNLSAVTGDKLSLILEATGGDDFAFSSKESGAKNAPILTFKLPSAASKYEAIKVYPNPSSDRITLDKVANENTKLLVYDFHGKVVLEKIVSPTSKTIEISELSDGLYFISLNGKQYAKFIRK